MDADSAILTVAKLAVLFGGYMAGLTVAVVWHELGHAMAALVVTRQSIVVEIGRGTRRGGFALGRLSLRVNRADVRSGATRYDRSRESRARQSLVVLAGPLASLAACAACAVWSQSFESGGWAWVLVIALLVANLRILVTALWPMAYQPDGEAGETWLSDGLDLWRLWRG